MKQIQKISGALILALFVLSIVPMAIADLGIDTDVSVVSEVDDTLDTRVESDNQVSIEDDEESTNVEVESETSVEVDDESEDNTTTRTRAEVRQERKENAQKRVEQVRVALSDARERFLEARLKFNEAKENHKERTQALVEMRSQVRNCEGNQEECEGLKIELRQGVAMHLENTLEMMERSLVKLEAKVDESALSEDEKADLHEQIDQLQLKIDAQQEVDFESQSAEEIRAQIVETKELYQEIKAAHKAAVANLANVKLAKIVESHQQLELRMQSHIQTLEEEGANVSAMQEVAAKFEVHVNDLEAMYEEAKEEGTSYYQEHFAQIKAKLKETKILLREFIEAQKDAKIDVQARAQVDTTIEG